MNWPWKKKKLSFAETAKFNWEADTNEELRQKLNELAKQYPTLREGEYREKLLSLFRERGLDLNAEQLDMLLLLRQEIPHGIAVAVESMKERETESGPILDIDAIIYCERDSHKGMVIGKGGAMLKKIASAARTDCEEFLGCRVNLQCWVKVKADWRDNEFMLNNFGFKQQPNR